MDIVCMLVIKLVHWDATDTGEGGGAFYRCMKMENKAHMQWQYLVWDWGNQHSVLGTRIHFQYSFQLQRNEIYPSLKITEMSAFV